MKEKIKVFEAFSGYGSQSMALEILSETIGLDFEVVGISEIDTTAIKAYYAARDERLDTDDAETLENIIRGGYQPTAELTAKYPNYGDISKIDWANVPDFNLFTYSFPCTDISNAGLQKGLSEGSGTRSSLLWECARAIESKRPKFLLMENVDALVNNKFMPDFKKWHNYLESLGYSSYHQIMNAKDYGVPQSRKRVIMMSILGDAKYYFPAPFKLERRLKDVLEKNVDESYYLSDKKIVEIQRHCERKIGNTYIDTRWELEVKIGHVEANDKRPLPYTAIEISRDCHIGEFLKEFMRVNGTPDYKGSVSFQLNSQYSLEFDSVADAMESEFVILHGMSDNALKAVKSDIDESWIFLGFYIDSLRKDDLDSQSDPDEINDNLFNQTNDECEE